LIAIIAPCFAITLVYLVYSMSINPIPLLLLNSRVGAKLATCRDLNKLQQFKQFIAFCFAILVLE